ncbi:MULTISPECIES: hypothetical protein [Streptomyces]|uniref:hypothetical protein n=1 Tax=Streptomyces TaxID=1883 RepID=UPI002108D73B|nr:hypothetical protein [Streptomyces longispororuber]MCQ4210768.1 hypothetical protein [Streptomyces longispororuber]
MNIRKRLAATAVTAALAGAGLVGTASTASAATCYGSAHSYTKPEGYVWNPGTAGKYYTTTSNCADINIKTTRSVKVTACFYPTNADPFCAAGGYKTTTAGVWKVLATDVKDGTKFKFMFYSPTASSGVWAA